MQFNQHLRPGKLLYGIYRHLFMHGTDVGNSGALAKMTWVNEMLTDA